MNYQGFQLNFSLNLEGNISGREVILPFNLPSMVINNKKYFKQTTKNTRTGNLHFLKFKPFSESSSQTNSRRRFFQTLKLQKNLNGQL